MSERNEIEQGKGAGEGCGVAVFATNSEDGAEGQPAGVVDPEVAKEVEKPMESTKKRCG